MKPLLAIGVVAIAAVLVALVMRPGIQSCQLLAHACVRSDHTPATDEKTSRPHILLFVTDDMGWQDVGYHNPEMPTPTIDKLAADGIKLEQMYVQPMCTPSRAALLTGRYPIRHGLQHFVILPASPAGLPLNETLLPQVLKRQGYDTHFAGKWHLGFSKRAMLPTNRGFDSHIGTMQGQTDFYVHNVSDDTSKVNGYDFRRDEHTAWEYNNTYATDIYVERARELAALYGKGGAKHGTPLFMYFAGNAPHVPLEGPPSVGGGVSGDGSQPRAGYDSRCAHINEGMRRDYCVMIASMDDSLKQVVEAYQSAGLWDNTLLIFTSDNGGIAACGGSNLPLRGSKGQLWEGGVRAVSFVSGGERVLPAARRGTVDRQLRHISDWFPTLLRLAGCEPAPGPCYEPNFPIDGVDIWDSLIRGGGGAGAGAGAGPRTEVLINIDPMLNHSAIRVGDYKLLLGRPDSLSGARGASAFAQVVFEPTAADSRWPPRDLTFLFNVVDDPAETVNLAQQMPELVQSMAERLSYWQQQSVPVNFPPVDRRADPQLHGGAWEPWLD